MYAFSHFPFTWGIFKGTKTAHPLFLLSSSPGKAKYRAWPQGLLLWELEALGKIGHAVR